MEGAVRVFAGEYGCSTLYLPDDDNDKSGWVITPAGAWCRILFLTGALTEVTGAGDMVHARVADPTGAFNLVIGGRNNTLAETFYNLPVPSFVSITARSQMYVKNERVELSIRPDHVQIVNRQVRDQWVLTTAKSTLGRIREMDLALLGRHTDERMLIPVRHYSLTKTRLKELVLMVEDAIKKVCLYESDAPKQSDIRNMVMGFLDVGSGPRGVAVSDIIDHAEKTGISQESVIATIETLILEDECYQPQKGFVKLL